MSASVLIRQRVAIPFIALTVSLNPVLAEKPVKPGIPPLIETSSRGALAAVRKLVDQGARLEERTRGGMTALTAAIQNQHPAVVRLLLQHGAAVNGYADANGWSPLMQAIVHAPFIPAELDAKNQTTASLPMEAPENIQNEIIEMLLKHGASTEGADRHGETALTLAAQQGRASIVKQLIGHGAAINGQNRAGQTALMLASRDGDQGLVVFLIQSGADVSVRDNHGQMARDMFDAWRYPEISRLLEDVLAGRPIDRP